MVGVVLACIGLYYLLTVCLMLFVWVKTMSGPVIAEHIAHGGSPAMITGTDLSLPSFFLFTLKTPAKARSIVNVLNAVSIISLLSVLFSHGPLNALFIRRRRRKTVPARLQERAEEVALRSARMTGILCFLAASSVTISGWIRAMG